MDISKENIQEGFFSTLLEELNYFFISLRPKQWSKNLFLFSGIVFSGKLYDEFLLIKTILAFLIFCLASGCIYIFNDIVDLDNDQFHPEKSKRPIAAGFLAMSHARIYASIGAGLSLSFAFLLNPAFCFILALYIGQNILYSTKLKSIVILDILMISFGFVLRVISGSVIVGVLPSEWVLLTTLFLALLLGFGKRRSELLLLDELAQKHRTNLAQYTLQYLDYLTFSMANLCIISYLLFVLTSGRKISFIVTVPFVLYAILRYLYLLFVEKRTQGPEILALEDKPLRMSIVLWTMASFLALYIL